MSDSSNRGSVFKAARQGRDEPNAPETPRQDEAAPTTSANVVSLPLADYTAFDLDAPRSRVSRLRVNFSDGSSSLFNYAYLVEVLTTSHQFVSLIFTSTVVTLQGRNLSGLLDVIQEERVLCLNPFDEKRFARPEQDAPIIESIVRDTGEE